ncbi:MAG: heavy-metal-associated domain-containing protein [Proteobacteria bacterium]|nr:heavy-metal-associated domain-containing protein [Pseudomonadota bacterium]
MTLTYTVTGMTCGGCKGSVERVVKRVAGVEDVRVELETGAVEVDGAADRAAVIAAIEKAGFGAQAA